MKIFTNIIEFPLTSQNKINDEEHIYEIGGRLKD